MNAYLATGAALLVYMMMAWVSTGLLRLSPAAVWIVRGVLLLLGLIAAAIFLWFRSKLAKKPAAPGKEAEPAGGGSDEVDLLIREAQSKLASAQLGKGAKTGNLPVIFLMGEPGSAKTTTMLQSGLEPELLAGQVYRDTTVIPTRSANLWFARRAIFVEAGGKLLADSGRWTRMVRRLQPGKLGSVVGKGQQAPRAALVCFDAEALMKPGAAEANAVIVRNLHARLSEISQALGISFPVYVLFTRMDRLPFFAEYVRNLSNEEATQVLGVTLPLVRGRSMGVYAEEEAQRLTNAFQNLFYSLCEKRPEFLSREYDPEKLPGIYEFPREFRKLRSLIVQLLVDLCRPSQLTTSPFLRGFYFSGVRPVIIEEVAPAAVAPRPVEKQSSESASGATRMFNIAQMRAEAGAQAAAPAPVTGMRKVPQWVFLSHLFNDVLLQDHIAMGASGSSTKTNLLRRVLLLSGAALCVLLSIAFTVSYFGNRRLESQALEAARGISSSESSGTNLPSLDALKRLETLRQSLLTLTTYEREGPPTSLRWGLYAGSSLYPEVHRLYFDRFRQLLFGSTQDNLLASLKRLPNSPSPSDEYGVTYDTLKAYLITTSHHDKSTKLFLSPVLLDRWSKGRNVDGDRMQLAQKQFDFYSEELKVANPFSSENDSLAVERGRRYLSQFAGAERVYQFMLAEANKSNPSINFNRKFPNEAVVDNRDVAGAFTKGGWKFMQDAIKNSNKFFSGEQWVLGDQAAANVDRGKLEQQLNDRYYQDFVNQWRAYLKSASVVKYKDLPDAAKKLGLLSGPQSPLLALFSLASENTAVEAPQIAKAFSAVQFVVPPGSADRFIGPNNTAYMNSLVTLGTSLDQVASQPPPANEAAANKTLADANSAKGVTRQAALNFGNDPEAGTVRKLMEDPITYAEGLLRGMGPAELNAKGKALCAQFRPVMNKYPFNPNSSAQASLAEVNSLFKRPEGAVWAFYESSLKTNLPRQGTQYAPVPGGGITLSPAFVNWFNRVAAFSDALYGGGSAEPHLSYNLKLIRTEGIDNVGLTLDGQNVSYTAPSKQFVWPGSGVHEAKGTVKFGAGPPLTWSNKEGLWAIFQFFGEAENRQGNTREWVVKAGKDPLLLEGKPVTVRVELDMGAAPPVFQRGYFSTLSCVSEVAR